jgi:peptide/nickel transport system substrate-binding protein
MRNAHIRSAGNRFPKLSSLLLIFLAGALLAGCRAAGVPQETPFVAATPLPSTETAAPQPVATDTATPVPTRTLVLCLQTEPDTLYIYGGNTRSMWSVLESMYDGPIDSRGFDNQAVIVQKVPSLADGDAQLQPVTVKAGDSVVDVDGNLVALEAGTKVLPAGCSQPGCAISYDGTSELTMDQLVVNFKLLTGLKWSDGKALTAADSVFSYRLAADPATPSSKYLTDRTASYQAMDDISVTWTGLPGFYEQRYGTFFWPPLPEHVLGTKSAAQMLSDPAAARSPLGWGPYVIREWVAGDHLTLDKNPNYFRASEGLPKFDTLVYRFVGEAADGDMNALLAGECDAVDQNPQFLEMVPGLLQRETQNKLKMYVAQGPEWEHLDFGVRPASYDDGYTPGPGADRVDLFGDARTRQAFATCIDRSKITTDLLHNRSSVPNSYLPPSHPLYQKDLQQYAYDPAAGAKLLDEVGWKDTDNSPDTPRVAAGVAGVPDGTPLTMMYQTTQAGLRKQVAESISADLKACGIQVSLKFLNPGELFGPGPEGIVFGRKFDLAQFSWEASARPNCLLYASSQVPDAANHWIGANVTGYSSEAFDAACSSAYWARPTDADYAARNRQAQELFARELPVIPLYSYVKIAIARADLCGLEIDPTARSVFWNIEGLDYGGACAQQ